MVDDFSPPLLINDSAVEVLQTRDMPLLPVRALIDSYHGSMVDYIESAVPYYYRANTALFGDSLAVFTWSMRLLFALSCVLFYFFIARRFSPARALIGTAFFLTAAYTLWPCMILTRNGASVTVCLAWILAAENLASGKVRHWLVFGLLTLVSLLTYSSFKIVITAGYFLLGVQWLKQRRFRFLALLSLTAATVIATLAALAKNSLVTLFGFIERGSYVSIGFDESQSTIHRSIDFLWRTFALPFTQSITGFMADPMHVGFSRGMLTPALTGFFVLGLVVLLYRYLIIRRADLWLGIYILATIGLSTGGPSLKTTVVLWPFILLITLTGLFAFLDNPWAKKIPALTSVLLLGLLIFSARSEHRFIHTELADRIQNGPDAQGLLLGRELARRDFNFVVYHARALDLSRLDFPAFQQKSLFCFDALEFISALEKSPAVRRVLYIAPDEPVFWPTEYQPPANSTTEQLTLGSIRFRIETRLNP